MKSPFKQAVDDDIDDVFLNLEEFAEEHEIDGEKVSCVIDTIMTQGDGDASHIGIFVNQVRIFVRQDLIEVPVEGEVLRVDGHRFLVKSVSREMGVVVISAERNSE